MSRGEQQLGFLSRSSRIESQRAQFPDVGPGAYAPPSSVQRAKPAYTPFLSTAHRADPAASKQDMPGPSVYNPQLLVSSSSASRVNFVSTSKRFQESNGKSQTPGPGEYSVVEEKKRWKQRTPAHHESTSPTVRFDRIPSAPSVPVRHQSYGYTLAPNGELVMQTPASPGYTGDGPNSVGPGDYNPPSPTFRTKGGGAAGAWSKFASREQMPGYEMKKLDSTAPGPGSYEQPSSFDRTAPETFVDIMNVKRNKYTSSFQSNSERAFAAEMKYKASLPGPGRYQLPSAIEVKEHKPAEFQCFNSSSDRFPTDRNVRRSSAPPVGAYNAPVSDFDNVRLKALKKRLLTQRSPWAASISFGVGDTRFKSQNPMAGPAPGEYNLGSTLQLKKSHSNAASFGSTEERFRDTKFHRAMARSLSNPDASSPFMGSADFSGSGARPTMGQRYNFNARNKKAPRDLVRRSENTGPRIKPAEPVGPAPGTYDCRPKWCEGGGPRYREPSHLPVRHNAGPPPGPGDYDVDSAFSMGKNVRKSRTNVMISTAARHSPEAKEKASIPGPGAYGRNVVDPTWVKPSYNIMIAEQAARNRH